MPDLTITCPSCSTEIPLTESLAGPLIAEEREAARQAAEELAKAQLDKQLAEAARKAGEAEAERTAEIERLKEDASARDAKLKEAQEAQAKALSLQRTLEDRQREMDLTVQKLVNKTLEDMKPAQAAKAEAELNERMKAIEEAHALKMAERDQQVETMRTQIETLQKKAAQGSQQLQGEAAEIVLEERLATAFPSDTISPVGKGVRGADCLQSIDGAGSIIWESKRTLNWGGDWTSKLKEDQRREGADIAILVSAVLPKEIDGFGPHDGIWVSQPRFALPLATALRQSLIEAASARTRLEGQSTKMEMVYDYLTGTRFRQRVEAIVEKFEMMREDLEREKKFYARQWAKREAQIGGVIDATLGMYGDLEGIAGRSMPAIDSLDGARLEGPDDA